MLQIIRDRAQGIIVWTIVGLIIITFALFGLSSYLSGSSVKAIASVDGKDIKQNDFQQAYRRYQDRLRQMMGASYRADMFNPDMVKKQVLNGLINQRLLSAYLEDQKIYPSDQLIAQMLQTIPAFKDENGKFSVARYQELIRRQGMSAAGFEASLAHDIASQELNDALSKTAFVTPKELALYQRLKNQQRDIGYLLLDKEKYLDGIKVSDADVDKYYQAHLHDFMTREMVKVDYVDLDLDKRANGVAISDAKVRDYYKANQSSYVKRPEQRRISHILINVNKDTDDAAAKAKLEKILAEYKAGKTFAALAKQYSQDPVSAKQGGDLGFFTRRSMEKAFQDTAFMLKKDEVSQPVKSRFGYHLIKVTGIKPAEYRPFSEVKAAIKHKLQLSAVEQQFYVDAEKLDNLSYDNANSLEPIVDQLGLKLEHSDFFSRQGEPGLFANPKILEAAFSDDVLNQKHNSAVIEITDTRLIVLRVAGHRLAKQKPLSEVKPEIVRQLKAQAAMQQAASDAKNAATAIREGTMPSAWIKENHKGQWNDIGFIGRTPRLDPASNQKGKTPVPEALRKKAFELPKPAADKPSAEVVSLANGDTAVLLVRNVKEAKASTAMAEQYRRQLQSAMGRGDYNSFIQELRAKADISIHMENIQ